MSDKELWTAVFIAAIRAGKAMGIAEEDADHAVKCRNERFPKRCPSCDEELP